MSKLGNAMFVAMLVYAAWAVALFGGLIGICFLVVKILQWFFR